MKSAGDPRWRVPKLIIYRVAVPSWRFVENRYLSGRIGTAVVLGKWCVSLVWKRP